MNGVYKGLMKRSARSPTVCAATIPDVFLYQTDLDKAKELILAGGFEEGDIFDYMVDANEESDQTVAQLFQANVQQWASISSSSRSTTRRSSRPSTATPRAEERPHFIGGWGWWPDYNDPWNQLWPNFTEANVGGGGSNGGRLGQPALRGDHGARQSTSRARSNSTS